MITGRESTMDCYIGKRIKAYRKAAGLSQKELAKKIGVSFQQLQKYESGENRVSAGRLWQISDSLNVEVIHFFSEEEEKKEKIMVNDIQTRHFLRHYYKLQPRARMALLDFLESI